MNRDDFTLDNGKRLKCVPDKVKNNDVVAKIYTADSVFLKDNFRAMCLKYLQ